MNSVDFVVLFVVVQIVVTVSVVRPPPTHASDGPGRSQLGLGAGLGVNQWF